MVGRREVDRSRPALGRLATMVAASALYACSGGGAASFVPVANDAQEPPDVSSTGQPTDPDASVSTEGPALDARIDIRDSATSDIRITHPVDGATGSLPPGLLLWLSADVGVEVSMADGHVEAWRDRSGNGNDAHQIDETARPSVNESWHGGRPALRFDGLTSFLQLSDVFNDFTQGLSL